jgi:hypothetical protein
MLGGKSISKVGAKGRSWINWTHSQCGGVSQCFKSSQLSSWPLGNHTLEGTGSTSLVLRKTDRRVSDQYAITIDLSPEDGACIWPKDAVSVELHQRLLPSCPCGPFFSIRYLWSIRRIRLSMAMPLLLDRKNYRWHRLNRKYLQPQVVSFVWWNLY